MDIENANVNASRIEQEIEILQELSSQHKYREFWAHAKEIAKMFKEIKPLLREDRERLWSSYSSICETAKHEMKSNREKAQNNASLLKHELENLQNNYCDTDMLGYRSHYRYREFWMHAREISEMFKTLKPLLREDRESLWQKYQSICEEVKRKQNEEREESRRNRELLESLITEAYHQAEGSSDKEELDKAKSMQTETLRMLKERRLFREDREALWRYWKETNEKIFWKRHEIQESNFLHAKDEANSALNIAYYGDPYEALEKVKEVQRSLRGVYMSRDQRHELHEILSDAWNKAISRIGEIKEEKRRKYEEWRERMENLIERWESSIEKSEEYISRLEEQIDRLEEEEANARTDEYAERVRGWIEEKEEKISDVREQIKQWEEKIYSVKGKLDK